MNEFQTEILRKAAARELPEQLAADYTLVQLAQCAELIGADLLSGEAVKDEKGRVCSIICPAITLRGRKALESARQSELEPVTLPTRVDKGITRLRDNRWFAHLIIIAIILIGIGAVFTSLDTMIGFWRKYILHSEVVFPAQNAIRYVSHSIEKLPEGYTVLIHFQRDHDEEPWGRHFFQARIPDDSAQKILQFGGATAGQYFETSITNGGKAATAAYTPFLQAALSLNLSGPEKVIISGNHGLKSFDIDIK